MARALRVEYAGAVYHVLNRGNRRELIFRDDTDRKIFLSTLAEAVDKTGWEVLAYCLMPNHFHLVMATPQANLVAGMKWLLGTYTGRFNRRHDQVGHVFGGRYKSLLVDGSGHGYLKTLCDYVHLNPVRAKLVRPEKPLREFAWSSWPEYLEPPARRWAALRVERLLGEYGIPKDSPAGRRALEAAVETRRAAESRVDYRAVRRGWFLGDPAFRKELLARATERMGAQNYGSVRHETAEAVAEQMVVAELKRLHWSAGELARRPKGDPDKIAVAVRLRAETVMPLKWIAARLHMGTPSYVNMLLYRQRKNL